MKELIKGSALVLFFKIIGAASLFFINIIIANIYGSKYLGLYNLLFAILQISSIFSRIGLDVYVVKIIPSLSNMNIVGRFLKKVFLRLLIFSLISSVFIYFGKELIDEYLFKTTDASHYIQFLCFLLIPHTFFVVIPEILRGFHEIKMYSFLRNASQPLLILFFLGLFYIINLYDPIYAMYFGILCSFLLAVFILKPFLKKKGIKFIKQTEIYSKPILRDSYPMFLTSSALFLMGTLDSFMIGYFENEYQVGLYNASLKLSIVITFVLAAINGYVGPKFSKYFYDGDFEKLKNIFNQSLKIIWVIAIPVVAIFYFFPSFFLGLFGEEFKEAKTTFLILNTSFLINAMFGPIGYLLNMTNNHKKVMYIIIFAFLFNFISNIFLIPRYGINGAAMATLLSGLIWNMGCFILAKKEKII